MISTLTSDQSTFKLVVLDKMSENLDPQQGWYYGIIKEKFFYTAFGKKKCLCYKVTYLAM